LPPSLARLSALGGGTMPVARQSRFHGIYGRRPALRREGFVYQGTARVRLRRPQLSSPLQAPTGAPERGEAASAAQGGDHAPQSRALASAYSRLKRATRSAAGTTSWMAPMPWPQPQMSRQALAALAPSPVEKFILLGSLSGRLSGSMPALRMLPLR